MTGIIDLIFRHKGLYYVLDWKTNWLETYERPGMQNEMVRHGYDLQAAIYGRALSRWLGRQGLGPENFGGAVYVFVRAFTSGKYFESAKETQRCGDEGIFFMSAEFLDGVAARSGMEEGL
jgi:hypothetical protein